MLTAAALLVSSGSTKTTSAPTEEKTQETTDAFLQAVESHSAPSLLGVWDMTLDSPRGEMNSLLTIFKHNDRLMGKTKDGEFGITKDGDELSWESPFKTPMGTMQAHFNGIIEGETMSGIMEMTSEMMSGRQMPFAAIKK
ncbi:MAG: hypothetical protein Mars2KO_31820 [Maribacter sp.]